MRVMHLLIFTLGLLLQGCTPAQPSASASNQDYEAGCSTIPGGDNLTLSAGVDHLDIILDYRVPCKAALFCTGATFKSIMIANLFFGPSHIFDEWGVSAGLGAQRVFSIDVRDLSGTDRVTIEVRSSATGDEILARCNFKLTVDPRPQPPEITSTSPDIGQSSCDTVFNLSWKAPIAPRGISGYSYSIVSQDDPLYDMHREPDEIVDLDATTMSFTTEPLESGHVWEFNIRTVDMNGLASRFYSSFWANIEPCALQVINPKSGDSFVIGEWMTIIWEPLSYDGNDVSGGYNVVLLELLDGSAVVNSFTVNLANTLSAGIQVPAVNSGVDYRVRVKLERNSAGDQIPGLPEMFTGESEIFSIIKSN